MARAPKVARDRMADTLRIPVTAEQKRRITEAARANSSGMAAWARDVLLRAAQESKSQPRPLPASSATASSGRGNGRNGGNNPSDSGPSGTTNRDPDRTRLPTELVAAIHAMQRPKGRAGNGSRAISGRACKGALALLDEAVRARPTLPLPRVGPSVEGAVALQWDLGAIHFMVMTASDDPKRVYFQREGPGFAQSDGVESRANVIDQLIALSDGAVSR